LRRHYEIFSNMIGPAGKFISPFPRQLPVLGRTSHIEQATPSGGIQ